MIALVILAGVGGALVRYFAVRTVHAPWAVLAVNVVGSFMGGVLVGATTGDLQLILLTGLCGGLTTFSTFSVETIQLALDGKIRLAVGSVLLNLVLGIAAAALGYALT
jgi:CrcB protein